MTLDALLRGVIREALQKVLQRIALARVSPANDTGCVADSPWHFADKLPGAGRGAERHYRTMCVADICNFEPPLRAQYRFLFLWRCAALIEEAYQVVRAWGFTPSEIVWQKLTKTGKPRSGTGRTGRTGRASHATCIVATRGRPTRLVRNIDPRSRRRSRSMSPASTSTQRSPRRSTTSSSSSPAGQFVELFARRRRPGVALPRGAGSCRRRPLISGASLRTCNAAGGSYVGRQAHGHGGGFVDRRHPVDHAPARSVRLGELG